VGHLLLHCKFSYVMCNYVFWTVWSSLSDAVDSGWLSGWQNWFGKYSVVWNLAPLCLRWILWREWNYHTFEDIETLEFQLKSSYIELLCEWSIVMVW